MSIEATASGRDVELPKAALPKWPKLRLGRLFADLTQAHASALSIPYSVALGLDRDAWEVREMRRRDY